MPSGRYTRIEITQEAYMGLEAEAVLQGKTLKKLASDLILRNISQKALQFIHTSNADAGDTSFLMEEEAEDAAAAASGPGLRIRRRRISDNIEVIEHIKVLWSQKPRPSQREIAKIINYPASSTKYQIKNMLEKGELEG
ncbi:MAG: winged helix-turn-helix transcriptional regulator [Methanothrix sp.]|nr:MAG: winged helix-turn-helix transcriptional regulator [Methanothrix sp.]